MKTQRYLTPAVHPTVEEYISNTDAFHSLVNTYGSPLNIVFPQNMRTLVEKYNTIFSEYRIHGTVYYATKANKSNALLKYLSTQHTKVDVASVAELQAALSCGFAAERIEATGPKNDEFLTLCLLHGVLINVDDIAELTNVISLSTKLQLNRPVEVLIRVNDFSSSATKIIQKDVRFGINTSELPEVLTLLHSHKEHITFKGFSFHLATTSIKERAIALENCIELTLNAIENGLHPTTIDIGGGFSLNFLASQKEWSDYETALKESLLSHGQSISWNNSGLGFWAEKGTIRGSAKFSAFYNPISQFEELKQVLSTVSTKHGIALGQLISELGFELLIEPGRSLLDQVGITAARVLYVKKSLQNENLLVLEMNRSNLNAQDLEFMSDPILIKESPPQINKPFECFLVGNLCLPHDFITRRKVYFKQKPEAGDILVFINTAGYFMDFDESATLRQPVARKIAVVQTNKAFSTYLDETFPIGTYY